MSELLRVFNEVKRWPKWMRVEHERMKDLERSLSRTGPTLPTADITRRKVNRLMAEDGEEEK